MGGGGHILTHSLRSLRNPSLSTLIFILSMFSFWICFRKEWPDFWSWKNWLWLWISMSHFFSFFARKSTKNYMDAPLHHIRMWHRNDFISQVLYVHLCCCLNYWSQSNHLLFWSHSLVWHLRLFLGWCCFVQKCFCCCYCCFFSSVDNCPVEAISLKSSRVGERKYLLLQIKINIKQNNNNHSVGEMMLQWRYW